MGIGYADVCVRLLAKANPSPKRESFMNYISLVLADGSIERKHPDRLQPSEAARWKARKNDRDTDGFTI